MRNKDIAASAEVNAKCMADGERMPHPCFMGLDIVRTACGWVVVTSAGREVCNGQIQ